MNCPDYAEYTTQLASYMKRLDQALLDKDYLLAEFLAKEISMLAGGVALWCKQTVFEGAQK
jgi:hypothetical protein